MNRYAMSRMAVLILLLCVPACAQIVVDETSAAELLGQLDPQATRSLQCEITAVPPALTFSFRFQSGYLVRVPLRQFHGAGHSLSILVRVTARRSDRQPVYLLRSFDLPDVPDTNIAADLAGAFFAGEGHYQLNAVVFDDAHRVCRADWQVEVRPRWSELDRMLLAPDDVLPVSSIADNAASSDAANRIDSMTILVHAASFNPNNSQLEARDVITTIGSLAALLEQLPATSVRLIVFNLHQVKELYRKEDFSFNDLEKLSRVLDGIQLGQVDFKVLQHPQWERDVLNQLMHRELHEAKRSSYVVFLGPDGSYGPRNPSAPTDVPAAGQRDLQFRLGHAVFAGIKPVSPLVASDPRPPAPCQSSVGNCGIQSVPAPVMGPRSNPGPIMDADAIGGFVRKLKGRVFVVRTPADFAKAVDRIARP